ncbi:hypothetical protein MTO96_027953 [Rhipicephalus appendiculatus]
MRVRILSVIEAARTAGSRRPLFLPAAIYGETLRSTPRRRQREAPLLCRPTRASWTAADFICLVPADGFARSLPIRSILRGYASLFVDAHVKGICLDAAVQVANWV